MKGILLMDKTKTYNKGDLIEELVKKYKSNLVSLIPEQFSDFEVIEESTNKIVVKSYDRLNEHENSGHIETIINVGL